ncbi:MULTISPECIES: thiol:disulfide interchange protein DsbA/DsbL [Psychrobacter]|uniref:thiol:disulfide interchange protein DsbA/DsbL n=1 Tax=Psychrobacter TaxID=497 RepID=UPI00146EF774|nr:MULTISPECIES: thiol:disulfide interchange protein DsbA/DsbL [Psychrobacter]
MKRVLALTGLTAAIGLAAMGANAADYVAGKDYRVLDNPETITGDAIIVREFFWYGCPHCYNLNPHMEKWAKTKPKDVAFFKTPAALNPVWEANARGFYAAQLLGFENKTHDALFDAIQKDGKKLFDQASLSKWYASKGVDQKKFNSLYNSFAVGTKIGRSQAGAKRYQLSGVPAVVVQGKYVVTGESAEVPKVVDYLVKKVRTEKK